MISKRRKVVVVLLGMALVAALAAYFTREREPTYQGKALSEWCELHLRSIKDPGENEENRAAIRRIGTNALPSLLKWINYDPSRDKVRRAIGPVIRMIPREIRPTELDDWLGRFDRRAEAAVSAFSALREHAIPAIPNLLTNMRTMHSESELGRIAGSLAGIGKDAIPEYVAYIAETNAPNRQWLISSFSVFPEFITNASPALETLEKCVFDKDPEVQREAVFALGVIAQTNQSHAAVVMPVLMRYLTVETNRWTYTHIMCIQALSKYGGQAREAVPLLQQLCAPQGPDGIREAATNALLQIAPEALTNAPPQ